MNKTLSLIIAAAALAVAAAAHAVELDWNQDVVGQFKAQLAQTKADAPALSPAVLQSAKAASQPASFLEAQPLDSALIHHVGNDWDDQLTLTLNNDGDRVGVEYMTCDPSTEHSTEYNATCEYAEFGLPQLRVDGKNIYWGSELVAQVHHGIFQNGVRLEKGYRLTASKTPTVIDEGFNRDHVARVSIRLEKN